MPEESNVDKTFTIKQIGKSPATKNYEYEIYYGESLIAHYWHDFRGEDHGISFVSGETED